MRNYFTPGTFCVVPNMPDLKGLDPLCQVIYLWICDYARDKLRAFPSISTLSKVTGIKSKNTIGTKIDILIEQGLLTKSLTKKEDGSYAHNDYRVLLINYEDDGGRSTDGVGGSTDGVGGSTDGVGVGQEMGTKHTDNKHTYIVYSDVDKESTSQVSDVNSLAIGTGKEHRTLRKKIVKEIDPKEKEMNNSINHLLGYFNQFNPGVGYVNKTHRSSLKTLIGLHGVDEVKKMVDTAFKTNGKDYAPIITTPTELLNKLSKLIIFLQKNQ